METRAKSGCSTRLWVAVLWLAVASACNSQSINDLAAKYKPLAAYQIRPGIVMFAKITNAGEICEATIESQLFGAPAKPESSRALTSSVADQILDELVPAKERGRQLSPYLNPDSYVAGGVYDFKQDFANVSVEKSGHMSADGLDMLRIVWTKRACDH